MDRTASLAAKDVEEMQPDRLNTLKEEDEDAEGESRSYEGYELYLPYYEEYA